jgi:hypothetical protein
LEIVTGKCIGRETVQYVSSICKYYVAYQLIVNELELKEDAKTSS